MKKALLIALGVIAMIVIVSLVRDNEDSQSTGQDQNRQNQGGPPLISSTDGENTIVASNQNPGENLEIDLVILTHSGYVVIHEDAGGSPGESIGVSDLLIGTHENVLIGLQRAVAGGETLHVMLHSDDGDGIYEFPGPDVPLKNSSGEILMVSFTIK